MSMMIFLQKEIFSIKFIYFCIYFNVETLISQQNTDRIRKEKMTTTNFVFFFLVITLIKIKASSLDNYLSQ